MPIHFLLLGFIALINLFLALFVFFRNPLSWVNRSFSLFAGTLSLWTISMGLLLTGKTMIWSDMTLLFGNIIGISSFLLFSKHFPEEHTLKKHYLIYAFIFPLCIFVLLLPFRLFVSGIIVKGDEIQPIIGPLYPILTIWSVLGAIYGSYILFQKYRKSAGRAKDQLRYLFFGFFTFLLCVTVMSVILPGFGIGSIAFFSPAASLLLVGTTAYAIVKHRLLDIRLIAARAVAYFSLIIFIGLGYIAFLFNIAVLLNNNAPTRETFQEFIIPALIALFFAMSFQPLKRLFERVTNKIFYKDKYNAQELLWSLSRIMASTLNVSHLAQLILNKILTDMKITYGSIVLIRNTSVIWVGSAGQTMVHPFKGMEIYELIHKSHKPHAKDEPLLIYEEMPESSIKRTMKEHEITVVLPLVVRDELIGGILFGQKSSGEIYSTEDVDVLQIVAPEIAVAVKNSLSFDEIRRFNITLEEEVHHATERLRNANRRLKELDTLKDEFVSIASHELRTPMTAIKSYLWMAINQPGQKVKEPLTQYLKVSYNSTERLIHLVNDMLTVSRIERNKIELKWAEMDVFDVLKQVFDELKVTADEKNILFTLHRKEKGVYLIEGDKEKLRQVFQNIIGNALKFTSEKGKITISVENKQQAIAIAISDTGPGIPKDSMKDLFKKFSKIEYSYAKHSNQPGTGLGLYISKQIVSLHGGDIQVESEVDVGTTFTVILPIQNKRKEVKKI
ncbi:MAG TPA: ATP-binding protein [Candidatus Woesebacteria bacterium]|nr:ATP-binding protein [Candidatus Woesebacteria bacterium]